jgi:DNA-binding NarL/FixJ family response regulator
LVVDDQAAMRSALVAFLRSRPNLEVVGQSNDGQEAIRLISELRPDVVVMDFFLPSLDGIEATRLIKAEQPDTAVVLLSAHDNGASRARAKAAGATAFVSKLGAFDQLERAINAAHTAKHKS